MLKESFIACFPDQGKQVSEMLTAFFGAAVEAAKSAQKDLQVQFDFAEQYKKLRIGIGSFFFIWHFEICLIFNFYWF